MAHVVPADIQQWLETTKLTVNTVDPDLEVTAYEVVTSVLGQRYNTATWVDENSTPRLVRSVMGMLIAAYIYDKSYSENAPDKLPAYGVWLLNYANTVLAGLAAGTTTLVDASAVRESFDYPLFWPTDSSTNLADPTLGGDPDDPLSSPRMFAMGDKY